MAGGAELSQPHEPGSNRTLH